MMQASPRPAYAASDVLPDLRMARLQNLQIETSNGRKLLRFDSIIANVGAAASRRMARAPTPAPPR